MQLLKEINDMLDKFCESDICNYINDNLHLFSQKEHIFELVSIADIFFSELCNYEYPTSYNDTIINIYMKIIEILLNESEINWPELYNYMRLLNEYINDHDMGIDMDKFNNIILKITRLYDKNCIELLNLCIGIFEVIVHHEYYKYLYGNIKTLEIIIVLIKNDKDKSICELIVDNCF